MHDNKKTYLDLYLENSTPKKRKKYFCQEQEDAIIRYNNSQNQAEKNKLFADIIDTCFQQTVSGVLEMKNFRHLPKALDREELIEHTYFRLVEKIYKFKEGMISPKTGLKVKAFSYFSTIAKHYILEQIKKHNKVLEHKADVEASIDLTILSEQTLEKLSSNSTFNEVMLGDYVTNFQLLKATVINVIKDVILNEESSEKKDEDFIKIGYCLKYLLEKWDNIEFMKKNEFKRILALYSGLNQQKVSSLFKKYKIAVMKEISLTQNPSKSKLRFYDEDELDDFFEEEDIDYESEKEINYDSMTKDEKEENKLMHYQINSLDEFESREYKLENIKTRKAKKNNGLKNI